MSMEGPDGPGAPALHEHRWDAALVVPGLLFAAAMLALAVVPDAAILRPKVVWGRGLLLAAAALLLFFSALRGRVHLPWPTVLALGLAPGLIALLHPLHTPVTSVALAWDEIERLLLLPVALWTAGGLLVTRRARDAFLFVLALAGIVVGGWAVAQRISSLLSLDLGVAPLARAQAGFGNPVFLGAWLVLVTPPVVAEALTGPPRTRWAAALAAGLCLPALLATSSVGAWLGFGVALVTGLLLLAPGWKQRLLLLAVPAVVAAAVLLSGRGALLRPRVHTLIWRDSWQLVAAHPGGVGPGQFQLVFPPFASDELLALHPRAATIINDAHSEPLQILIELGWPALVATLLMLGAVVAAVRRTLAVGLPDLDRPRFVAAASAAAGAIVLSFVSPDLRFVVSVLLLGSVLGLAASTGESAVLAVRGGRAGRGILAALALLGLLAAAWSTAERVRLQSLIAPDAPDLPAGTEPAGEVDERLIAELATRANQNLHDPQAHYDLGLALARGRRYGEAVLAFRQALVLVPGEPMVVRLLGISECLSGQYRAAVEHLEATLGDSPEDDEVRYLLAYAAFGSGDLGSAALHVEELLARRPDHAQARLLLARLRE